jgi:hypothetical protein
MVNENPHPPIIGEEAGLPLNVQQSLLSSASHATSLAADRVAASTGLSTKVLHPIALADEACDARLRGRQPILLPLTLQRAT